MGKVCSNCNLEKEYTDFRKDKNKKDGFSSRCKQCLNFQQNEKYVLKRIKQEIIKEKDILRIIIIDKKFGRVEALCDIDDYDKVSKHHWCMTTNGYVRTATKKFGKQKTTFLHRLILNCPDKLYSDHINRIKTDCRKSNLRICTKLENNRNLSKTKNKTTSKYKGVYKHRKKWAASITVNYKAIRLGLFQTQEQAALAYNKAAIEHFGKFASVNIIEKYPNM